MTAASGDDKPFISILVGRQLKSVDTGNDAYLMVLLRTARAAEFGIRLVMAHSRSFCNRPWMTLHPAYGPLVEEIAWRWSVRIGDTFVSLAPSVWARTVIRLIKQGFRTLGVRSGPLVEVRSSLSYLPSDSEAAQLAAEADRRPSSIVMAEYSSLGPVLSRLKSGARRAVLLHDLFSMRAESFRARGEKPDFRTPSLAEEAADVTSADLLIYASLNEMERLAPLTPWARGAWLRPEVPAYKPAASEDGPPRAVFIGTRHAGNLDAIQSLVDDIWPRVLAVMPEAQLWIAGSIGKDLTAAQAGRPGVRLLGRVADLSSIGGALSVGVAPTRVASGVSIKVAEYLRLGMPCIAYPVALEGFGTELDDLVDVVPGPDAFAARLVELLQDPEARRAKSLRGHDLSAARLDNGPVKRALLALHSGSVAPDVDAAARGDGRDHFASGAPASAGLAASSRHS